MEKNFNPTHEKQIPENVKKAIEGIKNSEEYKTNFNELSEEIKGCAENTVLSENLKKYDLFPNEWKIVAKELGIEIEVEDNVQIAA